MSNNNNSSPKNHENYYLTKRVIATPFRVPKKRRVKTPKNNEIPQKAEDFARRLKKRFFPHITKDEFSEKDFFTEPLLQRLRKRYEEEKIEKGKKKIRIKNIFQLLEREIATPEKRTQLLAEAFSRFIILIYMATDICTGTCDELTASTNPESYESIDKISEIVRSYVEKANAAQQLLDFQFFEPSEKKLDNEIRKRLKLWRESNIDDDQLFEKVARIIPILIRDLVIAEGKTAYPRLKRKETDHIFYMIGRKDAFYHVHKTISLSLIFESMKDIIKEISLTTIIVTCFAYESELNKWFNLYEVTTKFLYEIWFKIRSWGHLKEIISNEKMETLSGMPEGAKFFLAGDPKKIKGTFSKEKGRNKEEKKERQLSANNEKEKDEIRQEKSIERKELYEILETFEEVKKIDVDTVQFMESCSECIKKNRRPSGFQEKIKNYVGETRKKLDKINKIINTVPKEIGEEKPREVGNKVKRVTEKPPLNGINANILYVDESAFMNTTHISPLIEDERSLLSFYSSLKDGNPNILDEVD